MIWERGFKRVMGKLVAWKRAIVFNFAITIIFI